MAARKKAEQPDTTAGQLIPVPAVVARTLTFRNLRSNPVHVQGRVFPHGETVELTSEECTALQVWLDWLVSNQYLELVHVDAG